MLKRRRTDQDRMLASGTLEPPLRPSPSAGKRRRARERSFLRQVGAAAGLLAAAVLGAYTFGPSLLNADRMRPATEATLTRSLGRQVRIGSMRFSPGFGRVVASDVSVADDPAFSAAPLMYARRLDLSVLRRPLIFRRELQVTGVTIDEPTITLIHNAAQWNFYSILAAGRAQTGEAAGPRVRISRGVVVLRASQKDEPIVLRDVSFEAPALSASADNPFALAAKFEGGGTLKIDGRAGPVKWRGFTPAAPSSFLVSAKGVALARSNVAASLAPGIDGEWSLDGAVESDGTFLGLKGDATFGKLKLSRDGSAVEDPLRLIIAVDYNAASREGKITRCDVTLDKGSAGVTGTFTLGDPAARIRLRALAQGAPVTPLGRLLGAAGFPLPSGTTLQGGLAFVDVAIDGSLAAPAASGSVTLTNTELTGFDFEERLSSVTGLDMLHVSRDLAINEWRSTVQLAGGKLTVTDIDADVPQIGRFRGSGWIDANRILNFEMSALRNGINEKQPIPFVVRGACAAPVFRQPGKS